MQFVTLKIYKNSELLHTHENIPVCKITPVVLNWNAMLIQEDMKIEVITDSETREMIL